MSTLTKKKKANDDVPFRPSKFTETIKARVKDPLSGRANQYCRDHDCSKSEMVRVALEELFEREKKEEAA